jgi:hypothetical protein
MGRQNDGDNSMMIKFTVVKAKTSNPSEISVGGDWKQEVYGEYEVKELTAQDGIDALNELVSELTEPERITPAIYKQKLLQKAVTHNGNPFKIQDFKQIPNKLYNMLLAANERLNNISDEEARFLLSPSSSNSPSSIQP